MNITNTQFVYSGKLTQNQTNKLKQKKLVKILYFSQHNFKLDFLCCVVQGVSDVCSLFSDVFHLNNRRLGRRVRVPRTSVHAHQLTIFKYPLSFFDICIYSDFDYLITFTVISGE